MPDIDILLRNNVKIIGSGDQTLVMAHGFGCDQNMWRFLTPAFEKKYRIILFDYVGSGNSTLSTYSSKRYSQLDGYSQDIIEICDALQLRDAAFIGHSVSCMIGLIASIARPDLFSSLTMICPSPCFLNHPPEYMGGFEREDLEELIALMDKNYIGWANYLAPLVLGVVNKESFLDELSGSFCSTDPVIAKNFAKATFFEDRRSLLKVTPLPCLLLQSQDDTLAPLGIGEYMNQQIQNCELHVVDAHGHCLHMTNPDDISHIIDAFMVPIRTGHPNGS
ncbi:alpha/beta fold hydrolase [Zhongshania sp.]|uniref:alpha/beta fold hydrolase n=1 Tax=Zhongshania sp. TaxID=1971902 RepID=UPI003565F851